MALDMLSALGILLVGLVAIWQGREGSISPGIAALSLTYSLKVFC